MKTVVYGTEFLGLNVLTETVYQNGVWCVIQTLTGTFDIIHMPSGGAPGKHAQGLPTSGAAINLCRRLGQSYPDFGKDCAFDEKPETPEARAEIELFIKKVMFGMPAGVQP